MKSVGRQGARKTDALMLSGKLLKVEIRDVFLNARSSTYE